MTQARAKKASGKERATSRGAPVVEDIHRAVMHELGRVGYMALRVEDVAARANVHKTTIYRRFPTKAELVESALLATLTDSFPLPETGSLRSDLEEVGYRIVQFCKSDNGRALYRLVLSEGTEPELRKIVEDVRGARELSPSQLVERAIADGEIGKGIDAELLLATMVGTVHHMVYSLYRNPSRKDVRALVDLVLYGAVQQARPRGSAATRSSRRVKKA